MGNRREEIIAPKKGRELFIRVQGLGPTAQHLAGQCYLSLWGKLGGVCEELLRRILHV